MRLVRGGYTMKTLPVLVALMVALAATTECVAESAQNDFATAIGGRLASNAANSVEVDLAQFAVGIQLSGDRSYIINPLPFCARPRIFGEELRAIRAGEGIYDSRVFYTIGNIQVPIIMEVYEDCRIDPQDPKRYLYIGYVGAAYRIFDAGPRRPFVWVLEKNEVVRPDGTPLSLYWDDRAYPPPQTRARVVRAKIPSFWANGSIFYQFYNPSNYTQKLIFGGNVVTLHPRGGLWTHWRLAKDYEVRVPVELLSQNESGEGYILFGTMEYVLPPAPQEGVTSLQFVGRWEIFRR